MALSVLDGNQTATTLSSVVTGGEHIVAHSVVSLGANAIANITSAVSGSVVSVSNFPATQPISGSVSISGTPSVTFSAVTIHRFWCRGKQFRHRPNLAGQLGYTSRLCWL